MNDFKQYSEFYHYGVKGMHWGIRRYQNADGSLTPLGKRHYDEETDAISNQYNKKINRAEKRLAKANQYLSMDEVVRNDKKTKKMQAKKAYSEAEIKTYKELVNKELEKLNKMSYKEISDKRRKDAGKAIATAVLSTLSVNALTIAGGIPLRMIYLPGYDKNLLSMKERTEIVNKNMGKVATQPQMNAIAGYHTVRVRNKRSKKK